MMETIHVFWGSDRDFENEIKSISNFKNLYDVLTHIQNKEKEINLKIPIPNHYLDDDLDDDDHQEKPLEIENLIVHTDDYGGVQEWVILDFTKTVLQNPKLSISNVWLCNPPDKTLRDIQKSFDENMIIQTRSQYKEITIDDMRTMATGYNDAVIGQPHVMRQFLTALYSLRKKNNKRPVTILFLGDSGIGKTETAKYISSCLGSNMVRIQFSMQQTSSAYNYIFGSKHGENSLARELVRRDSNVILLDEFDKVSPYFYNAFYQMFDEGLFVDSNYSVDVSQCIIICTTNFKSIEEAENNLGAPIYSRFTKVIIFNQISVEDKLRIASSCYKQLFENVDAEDKELIKNNGVLSFFEMNIRKGYYHNMRILRNDIEDAINHEILVARGIIQ